MNVQLCQKISFIVLISGLGFVLVAHFPHPRSTSDTRTSRNVPEERDMWNEIELFSKLFPNFTDKELNLIRKLKSVHKSCGDVCNTWQRGVPGKFANVIHKNINCPALFSNPDIDAPSEYPQPPLQIPNYLLPEFTHHGNWKINDEYRDDANGVTHQLLWKADDIDSHMKDFLEKKMQGGYGSGYVDMIGESLVKYANPKGKTCLVIGSQAPWIEAILLALGAKKVTTFDYIQITSEHPQIETISPPTFVEKFNQGVQYDVIVSFSSLEHSGLGRYGDMLNPWGDLIAMARAWCIVKPGGFMVLGVPVGPDVIGFNSHRMYGPRGLSQLFASWEQVSSYLEYKLYDPNYCPFCYQPVHVLRKPL